MATGVTTIKRSGMRADPAAINREIDFIVSQLNATNLTENVITTPADKELLSYDGTNNYWINRTAAEAGLLYPVLITAAASGDYIRNNGTNWVDVTIAQIITDLSLDDIIGGSGVDVTAGAATIIGGNATLDLGALTAPWDAGAYQIRALQFYADGATTDGGYHLGDTTQIYQGSADRVDLAEGDTLQLKDAQYVNILETITTAARYYYNAATAANDARIEFYRSKGSNASPTVVADNDRLGAFAWYGYDGDSYELTAQVRATVDGSVSDGVVPSDLEILTSTAAGVLTVGLKIDKNQDVYIPTGNLWLTDTTNLVNYIYGPINRSLTMRVQANDGTNDRFSVEIEDSGYQEEFYVLRDKVVVCNQLQVPTAGSGAGVLIGGDFQIYRSAANEGYTPGSFTVAGAFITTTATVTGLTMQSTRVAASPYAVLATDDEIFVDTDGGAITVNLPVGVDGKRYRIINTGSAGNLVTLAPNGAELLLGANSSITMIDKEAIIVTYEIVEGWW